MKKLIISIALALLATGAMADNAGNSPQTLELFSPQAQAQPQPVRSYIDTQYYYQKSLLDFYLGVAGAFTNVNFKYESSPDIAETAKVHDPQVHSFQGTAYIGIGRRFEQAFYAGAELYGTVGDLTYKKTDGTATLKLTASNALGADLLLGGYAANNRFYLRAGILSSEFQVRVSSESAFLMNSFTTNQLGLHAGCGADIFLTRFVSIRPEFDYTAYQGFNKRYATNAKNSFSPSTLSLSLGVELHLTDSTPQT